MISWWPWVTSAGYSNSSLDNENYLATWESGCMTDSWSWHDLLDLPYSWFGGLKWSIDTFSSLNAHFSPKTKIKPEINNQRQSTLVELSLLSSFLQRRCFFYLYTWFLRIYTWKCWLHSSEYFCAICKFSTPLFCTVHLFRLSIFS